jgi:hypothetical protein
MIVITMTPKAVVLRFPDGRSAWFLYDLLDRYRVGDRVEWADETYVITEVAEQEFVVAKMGSDEDAPIAANVRLESLATAV